MSQNLMCDCCHTRPATLIVTEPTDACERGTVYCDECSTATCAGMERIRLADDEHLHGGERVTVDGEPGVLASGAHHDRIYTVRMNGGTVLRRLRRSEFDVNLSSAVTPTDERVKYLATMRDDAAGAAMRSITKLRAELERMEIAINNGQAGKALAANDLTPYHQTLNEIVAHGTEYRTLWNAVGLLAR